MILYIHYNMLASDILVTLKEISIHFIRLIVNSKIPASKFSSWMPVNAQLL
ncbi:MULTISPECIES: hypothetical protein [Bacillus cereus group]|uniref:hypothetical protein n=1 Tax=Bacillus cereus group TaxID=86661 RepID=UPI0019D66FD0|nr:hypothetical protein [Bacillus thuringiensis]